MADQTLAHAADRRPPAKMSPPETREPWSFRFTPTERERITVADRQRGGNEPTVFGRKCTMLGLTLVEQWEALEDSLRTTERILGVLRPYYEAAARSAA